MRTGEIPEVLFVCVHNAGRSQMAAGFLRHLAGDRVAVRSAGSIPTDRVNPAVVEVMAERGIELGDVTPKKLSSDHVAASDVVSLWGVTTPAPSCPASATWTGSWPTLPVRE